jgi:hypothetical protein
VAIRVWTVERIHKMTVLALGTVVFFVPRLVATDSFSAEPDWEAKPYGCGWFSAQFAAGNQTLAHESQHHRRHPLPPPAAQPVVGFRKAPSNVLTFPSLSAPGHDVPERRSVKCLNWRENLEIPRSSQSDTRVRSDASLHLLRWGMQGAAPSCTRDGSRLYPAPTLEASLSCLGQSGRLPVPHVLI